MNSSPQKSPPLQDGKTNAERLAELLAQYLKSEPYYQGTHKSHEVEVRFGTRAAAAGPQKITKIHYDNVIKKLYSIGFTCENTAGTNYLRIMSEFLDTKTGNTKISNIRAELVGLDLIQNYCKTDSLRKLLEMPANSTEKIKFTQKRPALGAGGAPIGDVVFEDYNYSISYKVEQDYSVSSNLGSEIIRNWEQNKKIFRFINRVKFTHDKYPIAVDLSIVKSSKYDTKRHTLVPELTIADSGVFQNPEKYEIELEFMNSRIVPQATVDDLLVALRACIRVVLGGIQQTNYPISYRQQGTVLEKYLRTIHGAEAAVPSAAAARSTRNFIGPNSLTLQIDNVVETAGSADSLVPNIRKDYVVTEKADGERRLLYIAEDGAIYMIDTNMNVIMTGAYTKTASLANTILDGEYIIHDKNHKFINLFAAFDVYFAGGRDVRGLPFIKPTEDAAAAAEQRGGDGGAEGTQNNSIEEKTAEETAEMKGGAPRKKVAENEKDKEKEKRANDLPSRLHVLTHIIKNIYARKSKDAPEVGGCDIEFECKKFYGNENIFEGCDYILSNVEKDLYKYNTDGLIFTPAYLPVGVEPNNPRKQSPPNERSTWEYSFKWKPPQYNTIDFLISTKKDKNTQQEEVHFLYKEGQNNAAGEALDIEQYKILVLRCGFNKNEHRYVNPLHSVIEGDIPNPDMDNENDYKPAPFFPSNPYDERACFCNMKLKNGAMFSEEGELIEDEMIVEFKYDLSRDEGWRWVPLRVRYDKTSEYRNGGRNYGNAYHVANKNWYSIHYPITEDMIRSGDNITDFVNDGLYYNNKDKTKLTQGLRDYHNLYIKRKLIESVAERNDTLIDYAVGKGGDIPKWVEAKLSFVFGIDVSRDNIQNQYNGICARYLQECRKRRKLFRGMFVVGNSGLNIRNGDAMMSEQDKKITRAVFGEGARDRELLGRGVYNVYGNGALGFNISSCQFALHYFFQSEYTLHNFIRNLVECTKVGGYFIGACFDGARVFELLRGKIEGDVYSIYSATETNAVGERKLVFEIIKKYSYTGFSADYTSVGYAISVYQESINQHITEYLVNFDYFVKLMEDYGFVLDRGNMNIAGGLSGFDKLHNKMCEEAKKDHKRAATYHSAINMSADEKTISFLNRAFVFKKTHEVDARKVYRAILRGRGEAAGEDEIELEYDAAAAAAAEEEKKKIKTPHEKKMPPPPKEAKLIPPKKIRKVLKKKIIIAEPTPVEAAAAAPEPPAPAPTAPPAAEPPKKIRIRKREEKVVPVAAPPAAAAAPPEPEPEVAAAPKKRCPKGTRRNKAGDCVGADGVVVGEPAAAAPEPPKAAAAPAAAEPKKRCPKGTRRNKAGDCEPTK